MAGYKFDFSPVIKGYEEIALGLLVTVELTAVTTVCGFVLSLAAGYGGISRVKLLRAICVGYIEAFRNTPLLVQLFFIYFGLSSMGLRLSPTSGATIALSINMGAYCGDILRAGLTATPRGQIEAGLSLGLSRLKVFWLVMIVPALQRVYPALSSQIVLIMLGTSVASQIGADELTSMGGLIQSRHFRSFEVYLVLGAIYLVLALSFRSLLAEIGRRWVYRP
ncbi:amino acid ABC transporter permease [Reyranella sp.]|uniref:amino acid ABC transporter permease n=1 Tax=Reyranella sp. TaxID=1929291 RepID=UPI003D1384E6